MKQQIQKTGGFSLVELMASVAIISLMSVSMLIMNDTTTQRKKIENFQTDVEKFLTYLRYARSDAISNRVIGIIGTPPPEGGFGTHIEFLAGSNEMRLTHFVDNNDGVGGGVKNGQYSSDDTKLEQITFPAFWKFSIENPSPGISINNTLTVLFVPPNADMIINDGVATNDLRSAELVFQFQGQKKRICLNRVSRFFEIVNGETCS